MSKLTAWTCLNTLGCIQNKVFAFFLFLHELYLLQIQHWRAWLTTLLSRSLKKAAGMAFAQPVLLQLYHTTYCSAQ